MDKRVCEVLEYNKITEKVQEYAVSEVGKECILSLMPATDQKEAEILLAQTEEAESILIRNGHTPIDAFEDIRPVLKRIHAALALSMGELLRISKCMKTSRQAKDNLAGGEGDGYIKHMASQLASCRSIEEEINRCILSDDEMADCASPELMRIRRQIRILNERAREKLNDMIKSAAYQKYLQEPIITIRSGRFVIPVKQEYRQQVQGLIHDQSGSGATLFIEPAAVVEMGNELKRFHLQEQDEIERILAEITAKVAPYSDELYNSVGILAELDKIFAKAAYSRDIRGVCPQIKSDLPIKIYAGRHPLLQESAVKPVDVWLGESFNTLIITGPNTGGKTVTLKTIGLFTLMAQSGIFIPAEQGSTLRFVKTIYADIGDEQSIEQSLSTFSSHMSNIVKIHNEADEKSLILLDELGAGTDPVEGAALAMGILESLHKRGALVAATTHYSEIKAFAMMNAGMENASMEFDVDKLCPTYRLFVGIPGKSNAFEIAKRLGLSKDVINSARGFLKKEDVQFEDVLQKAQTQKRRAEEEHLEARKQRQELETLKRITEEDKQKQDREKEALRKKAKEEAKQIVRQAKEEMEIIIRELRQLENVDKKHLERSIQAARDLVREQEDKYADGIVLKDRKSKAPDDLRPGDRVNVLSLNQEGTVVSLSKEKGEAQVQAGIIKITVKLGDIEKTETRVKDTNNSTRYITDVKQLPALAIDVRGKMVDEAITEVDRYIDDGIINGREEVQIIHGKGTGALRSGIQAYLKHHPKVLRYRLGSYGEGDAGVTIVTIRHT